jgi:hypothetical protein
MLPALQLLIRRFHRKPRQYSATTGNDWIRSLSGVADTPEAARGLIAADAKVCALKQRFILYRRKVGGMFYVEDIRPP